MRRGVALAMIAALVIAGGKQMTVQTTTATPQGDVSFKQTYTKS